MLTDEQIAEMLRAAEATQEQSKGAFGVCSGLAAQVAGYVNTLAAEVRRLRQEKAPPTPIT